MKNKILNSWGFTMIEILFVITIISFLSVTSITYFHNFVDSKKIDADIYLIKSSIDDLDNRVKNKEVYDYEIDFSWSLYYLYKYNQLINTQNTNFIIDEGTKSFTMSTNLTYTWAWNVKIYSWDKILSDIVLNQSWTVFTWVMDLYKDYKVKSYMDTWENLFWINFFSEDNLDSSWITTNFVEANTKSDKSWLRATNFVVKNKNNKIEFYSWSVLWSQPNIYLFFEKAGLEKSLKLSSE